MRGPERLTRWMRESKQPSPYSLSLDHPAQVDIAWAADIITELRDEMAYIRTDMREPAEREGGLMRHFYDRICNALEYGGVSLTDEEKLIERQELLDRIAQLEKDYDHAVETIQEIVNRVRPLLPVALESAQDFRKNPGF